jgi:hypothetical protein
VFDDFSRLGSESVHADAVHMQGLPQWHFGHQHGMPRHTDRGSSKVVNQSVLEPVSFRLEPEIDKLLEELDRALVVVDPRELDTGWIYYSYVFVVNAPI